MDSEIVDLDTNEIKTLPSNEIDLNVPAAPSEPETPTKPPSPPETPQKNGRESQISYEWAKDLIKGYVPDLISNSPKMEIFFCLLEESVKVQDRILVFSQSLLTLNLIERFLQMNCVPGSEDKWKKNKSYFSEFYLMFVLLDSLYLIIFSRNRWSHTSGRKREDD